MSYNSIEIGSHILGSDADSLDSLSRRPMIAAGVALRIVTKVVSNPVDLNGYASGFTKEVKNDWTEWMLSTELQSEGAQP